MLLWSSPVFFRWIMLKLCFAGWSWWTWPCRFTRFAGGSRNSRSCWPSRRCRSKRWNCKWGFFFFFLFNTLFSKKTTVYAFVHCFTYFMYAIFVGFSRSDGSPRSCRKKRFASKFSVVTVVLSETLFKAEGMRNWAQTRMLSRASTSSVLTAGACR